MPVWVEATWTEPSVPMARTAPGMSVTSGLEEAGSKLAYREAGMTQTWPLSGAATPTEPPPSSMRAEPVALEAVRSSLRATSTWV